MDKIQILPSVRQMEEGAKWYKKRPRVRAYTFGRDSITGQTGEVEKKVTETFKEIRKHLAFQNRAVILLPDVDITFGDKSYQGNVLYSALNRLLKGDHTAGLNVFASGNLSGVHQRYRLLFVS